MDFKTAPLPERVNHSERRWVYGFATAVTLLTMLPYLIGFSVQGDDFRFTGFVIAVEDGNSYIAKMLSGMSGAWLFRSPYSAMPQAGVVMFLPYILLGKLAAAPGAHEQLLALYQLFRLAAGFLSILASYDFLAFFIREIRLRRFGLLLITLGGGLGWILALLGKDWWLGSLPLDFYSPETFGFLGLFGVPHLALARALLLWALLAYLRFWTGEVLLNQALLHSAKLAGLWLLAGVVQPLSSLVIGFVVVLHTGGILIWKLARREPLAGSTGVSVGWVVRWMLLTGIPPGLFVLYNAWALSQDAYLQAWTAQNLIYSPHPLHYLVAYGLVLPFTLWGGVVLMRKNPLYGWLLVGWALALPLLAYMPVALQRRLPEGEWVAWVTLAMAGVESWYAARFPEGDRRRGLVLSPFLLAFFSTIFLLLGAFMQAARPALPAFRPSAEAVLFERLAQTAQPGEVVLAAYDTGNALPAWAPLRVLIGHGPESANLAEIQPQVEAFYSAAGGDIQRLELLRRWEVRYVFWGPAERRLGGFDPRQATFLRLLLEEGDYAVFEVISGVAQE